jgi:hypothetical protein
MWRKSVGSRSHVPVLISAVLLVAAGCDELYSPKVCTMLGCHDGVQVSLSSGAKPYVLGASDAKIVLITEGGTITCVVKGSSGAHTCSAPEAGVVGAFSNGQFVGIAAVELSGRHPRTLHVQVHYAETLVADQSFEPSYTRLEPNGPSCPPVCHSARVSLELP